MTRSDSAACRILIIEQQHSVYQALVQQAFPHLELVAGSDVSELAQQAVTCPVWLGQPDLLAGLLRQDVKPVWAQSTWAGIRPLLADDLPKDYTLTRAVGIFGQVMAEYVLCHLLVHERQLVQQRVRQQQRVWDNRSPASLAGRKALIVGTGDIGLEVAKHLVTFGVEVLGIATSARNLPPFTRVCGIDQLNSQAAKADYVINLLPDTADTHDLYDAQFFSGLKPEALFINTGRGVSVVDEDLVSALEQQKLAGAVIDVCRQEPLPAEHAFWQAPNLQLTFHTSAPTDPRLLTSLFLENLCCWQSGQALRGCVDFARGY